MNIFYMIFGDKTVYHVQAYLSIRSFQKQMTDDDHIIVMTTHPEFYANSGAETIAVTDDTIREWKGQHDFFWRVKIKAIEHVANRFPDQHLLYLDTDTFLYGSLEEIRAQLDLGKGMMHLKEGHPSTMMTKSLRMWKQVKGRQYGGVTIGQQHDMYNAGVVAIPRTKLKEVVSLALAICDGMLEEDVERIVIEQYSLSIALHELTQLLEAEKYIGHYWGNKPEWESIAYDLIAKAYMKNLTIEEAISQTELAELKNTPVYIHHSSTGKRLKKLIDAMFKDKGQKYV